MVKELPIYPTAPLFSTLMFHGFPNQSLLLTTNYGSICYCCLTRGGGGYSHNLTTGECRWVFNTLGLFQAKREEFAPLFQSISKNKNAHNIVVKKLFVLWAVECI